MGLVGYSDSEDSDNEPVVKSQATARQEPGPGRSGPQKLVSKSNPHKITVNLPTTSDPKASSDVVEGDASDPPAKRQKLGGLSGFNAMLPAPKRAAARPASGLGRGVSLKTGAEPAFSRASVPIAEHTEDAPPQKTEVPEPAPPEVKTTGNPMRFMPLSVARKPQKKKPSNPSSAPAQSQEGGAQLPPAKPPAKPKIVLFPMEDANERVQPSLQPAEAEEPGPYQEPGSSYVQTASQEIPPVQAGAGANTLDSIATDLNLSASARRQLLGRGNKGANIKVASFNVEAEYAANEEARRSGEQQEQKTVRSIAPGKHSLRQLVNAVAGQKEALEEQFASGRRNKKEAGSKYGW